MQQKLPSPEQDSQAKSYYTTIFQKLFKINQNQFSHEINYINKTQQTF